jgi:hypothetical protein
MLEGKDSSHSSFEHAVRNAANGLVFIRALNEDMRGLSAVGDAYGGVEKDGA